MKHKKYPDKEYPDYDPFFDIALLKLAEDVDIKKFPPVCLPDSGDTFDGFRAWTYGEKKVRYQPSSAGSLAYPLATPFGKHKVIILPYDFGQGGIQFFGLGVTILMGGLIFLGGGKNNRVKFLFLHF